MTSDFNINNDNLEIRKNLNSEEKSKLIKSKLSKLGKLEAWNAIGTNNQLAYSTHKTMRFFGKFPPPIARYLINKYTNKNSLILDPMCGSGTTGVEATILGRKAILSDINPLMRLLSEVKIQNLEINKIENYKNQIIENYKKEKKSINLDNLNGLKDPLHWFKLETLNSINKIFTSISKIKNEKYENFFKIILISLTRRVSKATSEQGRLFLDVKTAIDDVLPFFINKIEKVKADYASLPISKVQIHSKNISNIEDYKQYLNKFDLIILHPPYFNSYKYSSVTSLDLYLMGIDHANIRKNEIREFFKVGKPMNYKIFVDDMANILTNCTKLLKKNGKLALMMGDAFVKGEYLNVFHETLVKANIKKSQIVTTALRVPKYTEASWASSQRRLGNFIGVTLNDFVVVITK